MERLKEAKETDNDMKKVLLIAIMAIGLAASVNDAQAQNNYNLAPPSGSCIGGTFPTFYTKLDTVNNAGTDTFKVHMVRGWETTYSTKNINSLGFQVDVLKISGTPGGTISVYGSKNGGISYLTTALTTFTVTTTSTTVPQSFGYDINAGLGLPYTDIMYVYNGTGTMSCSWILYPLIR